MRELNRELALKVADAIERAGDAAGGGEGDEVVGYNQCAYMVCMNGSLRSAACR